MKTSPSLKHVINGTVSVDMLALVDESNRSAFTVALLHARIKTHLFLMRHRYEISTVEFNNICRVLN